MRVEVCADAPVARVVQDFVQPTQQQPSTCTGAAGETDLRAHRSRQFVARVLVITLSMECDFIASSPPTSDLDVYPSTVLSAAQLVDMRAFLRHAFVLYLTDR